MKTIRDIHLALNQNEKKRDSIKYFSDFSFRTRFIGNYLRRQLRSLHFEPQGYKRLLIYACQELPATNHIFNDHLCVCISFDKDKYDKLTKEDLPDSFIEMFLSGIKKAQQTHKVPEDFLLNILSDFRNNNYKNEWLFKSKNFKEIGVKAVLNCEMTIEKFSLTLNLFRGKEIVFSEEILETLPDEICYHYRFKDIVFENNKIKITSWYDQPPLYELDLSFKA